ncbi:MAG: hypothetical protein ACREQ9_10815 [Candidatus Binatia bacterium]
MKATSLRDHLKEYYAERALSPATLERLRSLTEVSRKARRSGGRRSERQRSRRLAAIDVAGLVAGGRVALVVLGPLVGSRAGDGEALAQAIGREIALNHSKQLAVEFPAPDYDGLRAAMGKLDFVLVRPSKPDASELRVIGARYCSIQGRIAAQIHLEDLSGRPHTLYETSLNRELEAVPNCSMEIAGARIRLWREAGLLLGLAAPAD